MDMDTRYNLRSQRRTEKVIPVELQLASDADFFSQTVGASHPMPGQVYSDHSLSTSASDLDISGLLDTSDCDFRSPVFGSGKPARAGVLVKESVASTSKNEIATSMNEDSSQESINRQILAALSTMGDRLTTLEQNATVKCKKSVDNRKIKNPKRKPVVDNASAARAGGAPAAEGQAPPLGLNPSQGTGSISGSSLTVPPPPVLRQEARIQQEVQQRLQELAKIVQ